MNKIFIITFGALMTLGALGVSAQAPGESFDREAFLVKRSAFITAELGLTPQEVELFIPLMEELLQKKYEAGRKCRKLSKEIKHKENPDNADYLSIIDECLGVGIKEAELEKEYYERFKKILSPEKLYRYKDVEYKFAREFVKNSGKPEGMRRRDEENRDK